ncbi:FAD-binding protein [Candidatus Viridilinea mediisalina]|uniref:Succinate dehydrogenase/fumarate reductase flavoprotein subunit n=1 Tax=Candidatus Viridilinea mediisalina TaxID=2024553 RepID=A0A2A6RJD5_9CHLR|nr:FAD-binding protein [Candidatus Viridilinea mediisalina]PDW03051.1 succinate dehydrogenase/fumarate reductase flavoprotein subunit [Candidatus Viridilinea mediisalina]
MELIDGYPAAMRESIALVEQTRPTRLGRTFPAMTPEQRRELLLGHHPDYKDGAKRPLLFGPNKGMLLNHELADLFEARPLVSASLDLNDVDSDVDLLIIGGGGAGTVAAIWAVQAGLDPSRVLIATKLRHGDSNSTMAQGGIQSADRPHDSPAQHFLDAMGGGHFTNRPELVEALVSDAPLIIHWHEQLGVMYDKDEQGNFVMHPGGGTSRNRMHSARDYTGLEIMRVLRDEARNLHIPVVEFSPAIELLCDERGHVAGAVLVNLETKRYHIVRAKATIVTTGGLGRLHMQQYPTTNHYGATADGLILAYRAGAELVDLDAIQYHPTGAAFPAQMAGLLITEKVRGMGAQPVNCKGEQFVYPLEPRDVEASAFIRECSLGLGIPTPHGIQGVWLDAPMVDIIHGPGTIRSALPAMFRMYTRFGIDMTRDPILVFPTLHYQNGGIITNPDGATTVPGLYAAGEVMGGVHGKNRLMGNSLLDFNVFGRRAGIAAANYVREQAQPTRLSLEHVATYERHMRDAGIKTTRTAPRILPDYRGKEALERYLDIPL